MKLSFFSNLNYTERMRIKAFAKIGIIYTSSIIAILAIGFSSFAIYFHLANSRGKGGAENSSTSQLAQELAIKAQEQNSCEELFSESELEKQNRLSYVSYRIKKGDMIGFIADEFGVTQDTIISVNNIRSSRLIQIGQYLKIPTMPGILYTVRSNGETVNSIAAKYKVDAEKCASVNCLLQDESLKAGKTLFVPDAALDWVTRQEINGDLFKKPLHQRFYFSSYYGWRVSPFDKSKRTYHSGIDMACRQGTPIYAALEGRVTKTGWSDVYGNYVMVAHHSGYSSLYAHMSQILAIPGQRVNTNSRIGLVGSTGKSTGPHLHFTVYKNGRTVNPANLWN